MTTFRVAVDQMVALGPRLAVAANALRGGGHGSVEASLLDADAVGAMGGHVSGWSHGRSEIVVGVDDVRSALHGAGHSYRGNDSAMAARLGPGS